MSRKINFQEIRESFSLQSVFNELDANLALAARIFSILCGFNEKTINKKRKKVYKLLCVMLYYYNQDAKNAV